MRQAALSVLFGWVAVSFRITVFAQEIPETVYVWTMGTASQNIMMASLAGIADRNTRGEMLLSPNNGSLPNPLFWLNQLKAAYPQVQSLDPRPKPWSLGLVLITVPSMLIMFVFSPALLLFFAWQRAREKSKKL